MPGYAKVPDFFYTLIKQSSADTFYVARARSYSTDDLLAGKLRHLGIGWDGETVTHEPAIVPSTANGRWSRYNVDGRIHLRRDLQRVEKYIGGWEAPNFGDWSRGSHTHSMVRKVFRKEIWYSQRLPLLIDAQDPVDGKATIGFRVDRVFDRNELNERDLRLAISLLRENIGSHAALVPTTLSVADWLADQQVTWELLPPGEMSFAKVASRLRVNSSSPRVQHMQDRFQAVTAMHPGAIIVGSGEFSRYFGFKFRDDLVVLENLDYGNALYVMYDDWEQLSQRSRIDLLSDSTANYERIVHREGWENQLRGTLTLKGHDVKGPNT